MTNPFHDWRNPARPCMWSKDYYKQEHVKCINDTIQAYGDGLYTTLEFVSIVSEQYRKGYKLGLEDAHYSVPAIPLQVVMDYVGYKDMIYIDDITDPDDPVMVCAWDFYLGPNRIGKYGEYTRTT